MKKKVALFLADGFEEIEAIGTIDILRRAGVEVTAISLTTYYTVKGANGVKVDVDAIFDEVDFSEMDMLVLPGGLPGAENLKEHEGVRTVVTEFVRDGKEVAAICAAPMVLGSLGLLQGRNATCYPGFESELIGANVTGASVVVDENIITGKGPGLTFEFALTLVEKLVGADVRKELTNGLLVG